MVGVRPVSRQRTPWWVVFCYLGASAGVWLSLWFGLEGWWFPFGCSATAFAAGFAGVYPWVRAHGGPPKLRDYLTLVKTLRRLALQATERGR
jgi:hypothetical protein